MFIPPVTSKIKIVSLAPEATITGPEIIEKDSAFDVIVTVSYNTQPLVGSNVDWIVDGAIVQISDSKTNTEGKATISMIGVSEKMVSIEASISNSIFSPTKVTKNVKVNSTNSEFLAFGEEGQEQEFQQFEIFGIDPVIILVPAILGISGFVMRKKGLLQIRN